MTITFDAVTVVRERTTILNAVTATALAGQVTVVVGKNGAGKSTLLRAAAGIIAPERGRVLLGQSGAVAVLAPAVRADQMAFVPDETTVAFDFLVRDVVLLGRYARHKGQPGASDRAAALAALAAVDGAGLADRRVKSLSRGERQRVMLARALAAETPVLILDEPTANLDIAAALRLVALLKRLSAQGKTILASIHDLTLAARSADAAICITGGSVTAAGPANTIFTPNVLSVAFGVAATRHADGALSFDLPDPKTL